MLRDRDRFWWALALAPLMFLAASVIGPWYIIQSLWLTGQADGDWATPDYIASQNQETTGLAIFAGVFALIFAVFLGVMAFRSRRRHLRRLAAWRGDFTGMPLSVVHPYPERALDVSAKPLEIMWRMNPLHGILSMLQLGVLSISLLLGVGVAPIAFLLSYLDPALASFFFDSAHRGRPLGAAQIALIVILSVLTLAVIAFIVWLVVRLGPILALGRRLGLRATPEGIEQFTELGGRKRLTWHEIGMFEVKSGSNARASQSFALYAPDKSINWVQYRSMAMGEYIPAGATAIENTQRLAKLLDLIVAHTGLEPRTVDPKQARVAEGAIPATPALPSPLALANVAYPPAPDVYVAEPAPTFATNARATVPTTYADARTQARNRATAGWTLSVLALILGAGAFGEYFLPLTSDAWANWVSVAALALLALLTLRLAVVSAFPRKKANALSGPPQVAAPPLESASVVYAVSWRTPLANRIWAFVTGLLLMASATSAAIAAPGLFGPIFASFFPAAQPQPQPLGLNDPLLGSLNFIGGFLLFFMGVGGIMVIVMTLRLAGASAVTIRADASGLTRRNAFRPILVPWSEIHEIQWSPHGVGNYPAYIVRSVDSLQTLTWPTSPQYLDPTLTPTDARPIGPDELAALVAIRIGRSIRIKQ